MGLVRLGNVRIVTSPTRPTRLIFPEPTSTIVRSHSKIALQRGGGFDSFCWDGSAISHTRQGTGDVAIWPNIDGSGWYASEKHVSHFADRQVRYPQQRFLLASLLSRGG